MSKEFFESVVKEDFLNNILQGITDLVYIIDKSINVQYVNKSALNWIGKDSGEILNKNIIHLFPKTAQEQIENINKVFKSEKELTVEKSFEINGNIQWLSTKLFPFRGKNGDVAGVLGVSRDFTEQKQIEIALKESEEKFRKILVSSPDSIVVADLQGYIIECNDGTLDLGKFKSKKEIIGKKVFDFIAPADKELAYQRFNELINKNLVFKNSEYIMLKSDNEEFIGAISSNVVKNSDGKPIYFISIIEDITEQKKISIKLENMNKELEEKVHERTKELKNLTLKLMDEISERKKADSGLAFEKERLFVTLNSIDQAVIVADINGKIVLANTFAEQLLNFNFKENPDLNVKKIFNIYDLTSKNKLPNPYESVLKSKEKIYFSKPVLLKENNNMDHIITGSASPIMDKENNILGIILAFRNITQQYIIEEELKKRQKLESLEILAGGIAHDFNNILTVILGNISLAKLTIETKNDSFKSLIAAESGVKQAKELTNQLLYFSREGIPVKTAVSIADLIKESVQFLLRGSNISFNFEKSNDLYKIEADKSQISQVIQNIIINAKNAMLNGGLLEIRCKNVIIKKIDLIPLPEGKYILIIIKDNGIGINKENLDKIFEPYFSTKKEGIGLGLAISYSIINKHNGLIQVESKKGIGSTFKVYLPAKDIKNKKSIENKKNSKAVKGKILILDDEEMIRLFLEKALTNLGYFVVSASNGEESINLFKEYYSKNEKFDLAILDLTIPGGYGGKDVVKMIKLIDNKIKVIASSGYSNDPIMSDFKKFGFDEIIPKPYGIEELSEKIFKILQK